MGSTCCFQQCELCEAGASINWAAVTTFDGQSQSCTDVYWLLVSESVESDTETCRGLSQVSNDCCYEIPTQQCTLCKDADGVTYNTRWNTDVTVNGITKTCGDFNTLLATQEDVSQTCYMAKDEIFNECCLAGSDTLVAIANQASTESDAADAKCSLCPPGQIGISAAIMFNNSSTTCKSAQVKLLVDCCREKGKLSPLEQPAFGGDTVTASDAKTLGGEGSVTAEKTASEEPKGDRVVPPTEFATWSRRSGSKGNSSLSNLCTIIVGTVSIGMLILS